MAKYDVFLSADAPINPTYLIAIQSDWIDQLDTIVVIPAFPLEKAPAKFRYLNPVVQLEGQLCSIHPEIMASVEKRELKNFITNIESEQDKISNALDMLFQGY